MTEEQVDLLKNSFSQVVPISDIAAALFYQRLFDTNPQLQPLFKHDLKEQGKKLMATIGTAVAAASKPDVLRPALESLAARHVKYGVKAEHFDDVGGALIWTLEQGLGPAFTEETRAAWIALYGEIKLVMLPYFTQYPKMNVSNQDTVATPIAGTQSGFFANLMRRFRGLAR